MTDTVEPVIVPASAMDQQIKAQLRVGIAALGGSLVLHKALPAWLVNDQTVDLIAGVVMLGGASAWAWVRARLNHRRLHAIAADPRVPDAVAQVAK